MPILIIIVGGIVSGLTYWLVQGNGMQQIDGLLHDRRNAKRRLISEASFKAAPLRSITNPAEAAGVLMQVVALARGTPTPEQDAAIEAELRKVLEPGEDMDARLVFIRHAATQAPDSNTAIEHLAPLLREKLSVAERNDLERMLEAVAVVHQGPIGAQERIIARTMRVLAEQH